MFQRNRRFWRQVQALSTKDLTILLLRHLTSTLYAALLLPTIFTIYLGIGQNLEGARNDYGISEPRVARSLEQGLQDAKTQRSDVVFVHNGFTSGDISRVISALETRVNSAGKTAHRVNDASEMLQICTVSFQGTTPCYGAVVFNGSPDEGDGGTWNYTLRGDSALGQKFRYDQDDNDPQVYITPLQRAIDTEILRLNGTDTNFDLDDTEEVLFSQQTESERKAEATRNYQKTFINYLGVSVLLAFFGLSYHLPGYIATEREKGLSALVDSMMATTSTWEPQAVRMTAYFYSFAVTYLPGWIAGAMILKFMIWKETSVGIVLPYILLFGLAATSQALIWGTVFRKAQLSGVVSGLVFLLLGVLVQAVDLSTAPAAILGILFTPCTMLLHVKYIARYEADGLGANLLEAPADSDHSLPAIALWAFFAVQIIVCPMIAAWLERWLHGAAADSRLVWTGSESSPRPHDAVTVHGLKKTFRPSILSRIFNFVHPAGPVTVAVNNIDVSIPRGQIVALLGANGSGKSTTLDAIAGIQGFSQGKVVVDASDGFGIAPQKNVLWDELSCMEHVRLFSRLKAPNTRVGDDAHRRLLKDVELLVKKDAHAETLSGGQKRKLQLAMMLTGDSAVCCIDEVSSGIDPLSRRKIWDILLAERGKRTIILTTHFLDEADLLSDKVLIMSKGVIRAEGSTVELKAEMGAGYRVHLSNASDASRAPEVPGVEARRRPGSVTYLAPTSQLAAETIRTLEGADIAYRFSSPTLEDVFLQSAEEYANERNTGLMRQSTTPLLNGDDANAPLELISGSPIGIPKQIVVLLRKRLILLRNNWLPYTIAFLLPLVAAGIMQLLVADEDPTTCTPIGNETASRLDFENLYQNANFLIGPENAADANYQVLSGASNVTISSLSSLGDLDSFLETNRQNISPGGFWAESPPTLVYRSDERAMSMAVIAQNLLSIARSTIDIVTSYATFESAFANVGKTLQLSIFFSVVLGIAPSFLSLYPNLERRTTVRGLQYSSGVRVLAQWASHIIFDFSVLLVPVIGGVLILILSSDVFWNPGYLIPIFLLYTIATILIGYIISLRMKSQMATWAAVTAFNGLGLAVYLFTFLFIISLSDATKAQNDIEIAHYVVALIFPIGSVVRAMLVSLNVFSQACEGSDFLSYPGAMRAYGAPLLYLALQSVIYFSILLLAESKTKILANFTSKKSKSDPEKATVLSKQGVQVQGLSKKFGDSQAVDDVSFDVSHNEVFALLGPNGAGKSTTISLIRGDIAPTTGDVFVEQTSVTQDRALARANMGVCPQADAIDAMTVEEHLAHYARLRGIDNVRGQVSAVLRAVGLEDYRAVMAADLSGGNKRKLSLGIALTGNPSVILLDEPSSGLDAAAKRVMWRTLKAVAPGRAILLTTHSLEEADVLAHRAGIVAKQLLAMGKVSDLQRAFGDAMYVHLVSRTAPHSSPEEMQTMRAAILELFPEARVEEKTYHGQMRFSVSASSIASTRLHGAGPESDKREQEAASTSAMGRLLVTLEDNKDSLGVSHYSVAPTGLNEVFLAIVGQHRVAEDGYEGTGKKKRNWRKLLLGI
jgi:ATP-binding cassette, subfamily A (ABC1), member 3